MPPHPRMALAQQVFDSLGFLSQPNSDAGKLCVAAFDYERVTAPGFTDVKGRDNSGRDGQSSLLWR